MQYTCGIQDVVLVLRAYNRNRENTERSIKVLTTVSIRGQIRNSRIILILVKNPEASEETMMRRVSGVH